MQQQLSVQNSCNQSWDWHDNYFHNMYLVHRWVLLPKQQLLINVYRFPTKENKLSFLISVCSKQMKVCPCSKTALTGNPDFDVSMGGTPRTWKEMVDTLDQ
jgi:hypothetical protein